ncbi:hypothetical protein P8452_49777 [Trifolium repens]|nr:hypothetical protein P8452_49777 [Trifolium repens]
MPLTPSISNPSVAKFGIPSTSLAVVFDTRLEESTILSIYINNTWAGPLISITIDDQFLDIKSGEKFYTSIEYEFEGLENFNSTLMWILICGFVSINIVTFVIMLRKIQNNSSDLEEEVCSLPLQPPPPMALLEDPLHLGL